MAISDSILDFMYVDKNRVGTFVSQVLSEGLVTQQITTKNESTKGVGRLKIGLGKLLETLGISPEGEYTRESLRSTSSAVTTMPEWSQAKALASYVEDLTAQATTHPVGSLTIVTGKLKLFDVELIKKMIDDDQLVETTVEAFVPKSLIQREIDKEFLSRIDSLNNEHLSLPKHARNGDKKRLSDRLRDVESERQLTVDLVHSRISAMIKGFVNFIKHCPFSTVGVLEQEDGQTFWFTVRDGGLVHEFKDALLKHGSTLQGDWKIVGILDALATKGEKKSSEVIPASLINSAVLAAASPASPSDSFGKFGLSDADKAIPWMVVGGGISKFTRDLLGRPEHHNAITPLIIFREVGTMFK